MRKRSSIILMVAAIVVALMFIGLILNGNTAPEADLFPDTTRAEAIPDDAVKMSPETDIYPPILHLDLWYEPVPLEGPINTAGAEDSPFIMPDGMTMYFFFTPDPAVPAQEQLFDEVTGIWRSDWNGSDWSEPERVWLQAPDKLALDGAAFVLDEVLWFASAREGYVDVNLFTTTWKEGDWDWEGWEYAGDLLNQEYQVGEMHLSANGTELYFHSGRAGGAGQYDLWMSRYVDGAWQAPENLLPLNTAESEGWPFLNQDGTELWFTRFYLGSPSVWRSIKTDGVWGAPELVVSSFAGEPTMDQGGNLYFVHHFFQDGEMIEADIYVAYRK